MNCEEIRGKLNEYIDGELSKEETIDFEMHLYECDDCKKYYMAISALADAVRDAKSTDLPDDFEIQIPKENRIKYLWRKYEKTAAVMVAAIALIIFAKGIKNIPNYVSPDEMPKEAAQSEDICSAPADDETGASLDETEEVPAENAEEAKSESNDGGSAKKSGADSAKAPALAEQAGKSTAKEPDTTTVTAPKAVNDQVETNTPALPEAAEEAKTAAGSAPVKEPSNSITEEAASEGFFNDRSDTATDGVHQTPQPAKKGGSAPVANGSSAKSSALKSSVDLSPVLSYSMPPADSFTNPDLYGEFSSRLSSLKSRASSASEDEKQAILNEFNSLQAEISYNLK